MISDVYIGDLSETFTDSKLKPCPFCGSEGKVRKFDQFFKVFCTNCSCVCSTPQICYYSEEDAVNAWNTRPLSGAALSEDWTETIDALQRDLDKIKAIITKESQQHG